MSGKLGSVAPAADTNTAVYTVPAGQVATLNVLMVNRGADSATFRLAIAATTIPSVEDYIEYDAEIPASGGVFERAGIVCGAGEKVVVNVSTADCSVRVNGFVQEA